jgi:sulfate transport system permease protein
MAGSQRQVLPGFGLSLGFAVTYLSLLVLIPLAACFAKAASLSWDRFLAAAWTPEARAAYALSLGASFVAAIVNLVLGFLVAWVLVRYEFPFKRFFDAVIDLPFALPTAVAGLVYSSLYADNGWYGSVLAPLGIHASYNRLAIVLVLIFTSFPFVVRAVQPVLQELEPELEEVSATLGASRWQTFWRVLFPQLLPALLTGFALAFARALGEYGSVVFVSSNKGGEVIAPMLIVAKLEEYDAQTGFHYDEAAAIAVVLLVLSFTLLLFINLLERWSKRHVR